MQVDIGRYIGSLLYTNQRVSVPGLGSFSATYQPAELDPVQGELAPPSKSLEFNENLIVDDGLLTEYICNEEGISPLEAQRLVDAYIDEIKEAIANREIVTFTKLGRLYRDYEGQLKFVADGTNYNTDAYGLPTINFFPIGKTQSASVVKEEKPAIAKSAGNTNSGLGRFLNRGMIAALSVAVLVVLLAIYFLSTQNTNPLSSSDAQKVPTSRVNVKPTVDETPDTETTEEDSVVEPSVDEGANGPGDESEELDTESPTLAPQQKYFVIIIGSFGSEENVTRLVERIYKAGFEPYTEKSGKLTKVGVQKMYTEQSEINAALKEVRKTFTKNAKLYKQ